MSVRDIRTLVIGASLDITAVGAIRNQQLITFPSIATTVVGTDLSQTLTNKTLLDTTTSIANATDTTKKIQFSLSGITTATTRTLTIPNANFTLVGDTVAQTLTNKTLLDTTTSIANTTDPTKIVQFSLSGITTGTTRTLTVPNANLTIVGTDTAQTLTNKTISNTDNTLSWSTTTFFSASWTSPITTNTDLTITAFKLGRIVVLSFPLKAGTTNATNGFSRSGAITDLSYRPAQQQEFPYRAQRNSFATGLLLIKTNGDIEFYADMAGSVWTSGNEAFRIGNISVTYYTA